MTSTFSVLNRPRHLYLDLAEVFIAFNPDLYPTPILLYQDNPQLRSIVHQLSLRFIIESNFLILPEADHEQYFYEVLGCSHPQLSDALCDDPSLMSHFEVLVARIVEMADQHLKFTCQSYGILEPEQYLFDHWHSNTVAVFEREPTEPPS